MRCLLDTHIVIWAMVGSKKLSGNARSILQDPEMGRGQDMYMFDRMDRKSGLDFGDGAHVIYANGMWRGDDALGRLMHDFDCSDAAEMYFDVLKRRVSQFKNSDEGRRIMCKAVEEFAEKITERREARARLAAASALLRPEGDPISKIAGMVLAEKT